MAEFHSSIADKSERIFEWLTEPDSLPCLILYGDSATGKHTAFWAAIERIRNMTYFRECIPHEIYKLSEGNTLVAYSVGEDITDYSESKTVIIVTAKNIPPIMAGLLNADVMKFEHEE